MIESLLEDNEWVYFLDFFKKMVMDLMYLENFEV